MALTDGNYVSTLGLTDVVNAGADGAVAVDNTGMSQGALYTLLNNIITNFNLLLTKIEADGATTTTYTPDNALTTLASRGIEKNGRFQEDLYNAILEIAVNWDAVLVLLDADGGVTLTDYVSIGELDVPPGTSCAKGLGQELIVEFFDDFVTKYNLTLANCDVDNA